MKSLNHSSTEDEALLTTNQWRWAVIALIVLVGAPSVLGVITNIINLFIFLRMGLRDSVTVTFFALSVSDLGTELGLVAISSLTALVIVDENMPGFSVEIGSLQEIVGITSETFFQMSTIFTCFLAVMRATCVVCPFMFKHYFTRVKSVLALCVLSVLCLCHLAMFSQTQLTRHTNSTRMRLTYRENYEYANFVSDTIRGPVVTLTSVVIVTFCITLMIVKLKESIHFKKSHSYPRSFAENSRSDCEIFQLENLNSETLNEHLHQIQTKDRPNDQTRDLGEDNQDGARALVTSGRKLQGNHAKRSSHSQTCFFLKGRTPDSSKVYMTESFGNEEERRWSSNSDKISAISRVNVRETRVIKQVLLVVVIFIVFKLPTVVTVVLRYTNSEFYFSGAHRKMAVVFAGCRYIFEAWCSSINIFVYYYFNTRYKRTCRMSFKPCFKSWRK